MHLKRTLTACLASAILICNSGIVNVYGSNGEVTESVVKNITEKNVEEIITSVPDINTQLDTLYTKISDYFGIDKMYVKELHILAGGQSIYADKKPDILNDITIENMKAPLELAGANTVYQKAEFIECPDDKIERPSKYYMPDALYSVTYDIAAIMGQRYNYNREGMQIYFDSLQEEVKQNIVFCEAVMLYTGEKEETVNKFYTAYEKMLYDKNANENVIEKSEDGQLIIKEKFLNTINDIGIINYNTIKNLAIILSFDKNLAVNDNVENIKEEYIVPYRLNYTSRENMMIAAMCLAGKVRYVWGGGHSGASHIDGINPVWSQWENLYPSEPTSEIVDENEETKTVNNVGFGTCLKSSNSWCPIHGYTKSEYHGETINSLDEYINLRAETFSTEELLSDKYREMLSKVDYTNGINVHTLDGLDCSGFASWLYNQITDKYELNSTAVNFTDQLGLTEVEFGSDLLPGDVFAWTTHIVIVVGKVRDNSKAYVTIEQTPNVLKFGVIYYSGASQSDIDLAKQIASEANELIGGLNKAYESPRVYCMDNMGKYTEEVTTEHFGYSAVAVWFPEDTSGIDPSYNPYELIPSYYEYSENIDNENGYTTFYYIPESGEEIVYESCQICKIGRFKDSYIDEDTLVGDVNIPIKDMNAVDIIQHTLTKLPISYVAGYNIYGGDLFKKDLVSTNLGVVIEQ